MKNFVFGIEGIQREEYRARDTFVYISEFGNPRIIAPCIRACLSCCFAMFYLSLPKLQEAKYSLLFIKQLWLRTSEVLNIHIRNIKLIFDF